MRTLFVLTGVAAFAALTGSALARPVVDIDSLAVSPYWYSDYFGSNLQINGVNQSGGVPFTITGTAGQPQGPLHITDDTFPAGPHFTNRHQAAMAVGGVPYQFQPGGGDFQFDVDVTINSTVDAKTEAGIWFGTAGSYPSSAGADIGQFVLLPDNSGEIAAFGGTLPFFSNNQPENLAMARAARGQTFHLTMIYYSALNHVLYGVDGQYTREFDISFFGNPGFAPNSLLGVYVQGPNTFGNATGQVDVLFNNALVTVPAPASAALLGLGGLVAFRRRR